MKEYWINDNGVNRKMTPEEIEQMIARRAQMPPPPEGPDEKIAQLEKELEILKKQNTAMGAVLMEVGL